MGQRRYVRSFCNDYCRTSKVEAIQPAQVANITRTQGTGSGDDDLSHQQPAERLSTYFPHSINIPAQRAFQEDNCSFCLNACLKEELLPGYNKTLELPPFEHRQLYLFFNCFKQEFLAVQLLLWLNSQILERQVLLQLLQTNFMCGCAVEAVASCRLCCLFSSHCSTLFWSLLCIHVFTAHLHLGQSEA